MANNSMKALFLLCALCVAAAPAVAQYYIGVAPNQQLGPSGDCGVVTADQVPSIQCLTTTWLISGTVPTVITCHQLSGLVKVTGGGTVPLVLPDAPCRGTGSVIQVSTDGKTSFTLQVQTPSKTTFDGVAPGANGVVPNPVKVTAGGAAYAVFDGNHNYNIGVR